MGLLLGMVEARSVNVKKTTTTTTLLFVCFQVNNGVLYYLDYVEDIYIRALSVLVSILNPNHIVFTTSNNKGLSVPVSIQNHT